MDQSFGGLPAYTAQKGKDATDKGVLRLRDLPDSGFPGLGLREGTTTPCQLMLLTQ